MTKPLLLFVAGVLLVCGFARADAPDSMDALQKLYADGNYKELIPRLNKALQLTGAEADEFNKYDLLVMKGEASLRTHAKPAALDAFKAAISATKKEHDSAVALATSELIRASGSNLTFTPKTKPDTGDKPAPIDIVDPDSRKQAFAALDIDILVRFKPKVAAAMSSTSLPQVVQLASGKDMTELKALEIAATAGATDSKHMVIELGEHAFNLMDGSLGVLSQRLDNDLDAANNRVADPKHPLHGNAEVMNIPVFEQDVSNIDSQVMQLSDEAKAWSKVFDPSTDLKPIEKEAKTIHDLATKLLEAAKKDKW